MLTNHPLRQILMTAAKTQVPDYDPVPDGWLKTMSWSCR
jgi:hypothetical protein